jgi:hypothetical protein
MDAAALRYRMAVESDLQHCVDLLPAGLRLDPTLKPRLPELWKRLLASESKSFAVIEDLSHPYPSSIEAFGLSVFTPDAVAERILAAPRPYFHDGFYRRLLDGDAVLLSAQQLAEANATSGINAVVLHFGLRITDPSHPRTAAALMTGSGAFYFFHSGFKMRTLMQEVYGVAFMEFVKAGGFRILRDFQSERPAQFGGLAPSHYPYMTGLRREDVAPGAVNPLSHLFHPQPPRLGFSRAERHLLERALLNEADPDIAQSFGVSPDAVKKTWTSIFARVARVAPFLMPGDPHASGTRGEEKRRHVLDYVRTHLEELRPYSVPIKRSP